MPLSAATIRIATFISVAGPLAFASWGACAEPQVFFCTSGPCTSAPGGTAVGGESNLIANNNSFELGVSGSFTLQNPLLLIVAVYDGDGTPVLTFAPGVSDALVGTYGLTSQSASLTSGQKSYDQLGLGGDSSESFASYLAADEDNGFAPPTSFTLDVFALNVTLASGTPITVGESGATAGSFIFAAGCIDGTGSSTGCDKNGDVADTPFTNAGLLTTNTVTEPSTLLLLGFGLASLGLFFRYRRRQA